MKSQEVEYYMIIHFLNNISKQTLSKIRCIIGTDIPEELATIKCEEIIQALKDSLEKPF